MGVYRHLLGDPVSVAVFRNLYSIPAIVEVRPDGPENGFIMGDGWMPFWLVTVVEAGVRFPLHPLLRDCLQEWNLCPCQLLPNVYKIIMGVVQLKGILGINLGVLDIEDTYDLYFCQRRELARRNHWKVNTAWHELVRNYCGHNGRAAWSLLGYTPHYKSFNTLRKVTGVDSVLRGEGTNSKPVTVAIPTGCLVESDDQASVPLPDSGPVETATPRLDPLRGGGRNL
ncbi:hypothetical protein AAC387_Pa10g0194 [Persea americana]